MRGEQNLQATIRDGKNSWSLKQRGDMRVEGKKFSVGGYGVFGGSWFQYDIYIVHTTYV